MVTFDINPVAVAGYLKYVNIYEEINKNFSILDSYLVSVKNQCNMVKAGKLSVHLTSLC